MSLSSNFGSNMHSLVIILWYYYGLGPRVWNFSGADLLRQTSTKSVELRRSSSLKFRQTPSNFVEVSSPIPTFDINLDHAHSYKHTFLKKQKLDNAQFYKPTHFVKKLISIKLKEIIMLRNSLYVLPRAEVHVLTSNLHSYPSSIYVSLCKTRLNCPITCLQHIPLNTPTNTPF